jgi:hypothetical protein
MRMSLCAECGVAQALRQRIKYLEDALRSIADIKAAVEISSSDEDAIDEYSSKLGMARRMAQSALPITK